ncbi:MAG: HEAT repeat domain-containing protein [Methanothrix sp.]|jgi:HEAT repeat protein|nr:HEAT repeat domain-containing protein [Methanothrix sp.]
MKWIVVVAILVLMSIVVASANKVDDLISDLKSEQDGIRASGAMSLGMIGNAKAVEPLIQALKNDEDMWVREAAATAIVPVSKNADYESRRRASEALVGVEATNEAVESLKNEGR